MSSWKPEKGRSCRIVDQYTRKSPDRLCKRHLLGGKPFTCGLFALMQDLPYLTSPALSVPQNELLENGLITATYYQPRVRSISICRIIVAVLRSWSSCIFSSSVRALSISQRSSPYSLAEMSASTETYDAILLLKKTLQTFHKRLWACSTIISMAARSRYEAKAKSMSMPAPSSFRKYSSTIVLYRYFEFLITTTCNKHLAKFSYEVVVRNPISLGRRR
jgi:hypothetical protein